ncbi:prepilin-type N-terminal cleavage/methylation domain-containing protein [Candidatus Nomurabacteria bacterium]|nr:prepilin-type N-terminal cleavage/methylation domain-containing protein [Candidatus Nomurabacteria bacterium]
MKKVNRSGFSIIELIIVIIVLALLAGAGLYAYNRVKINQETSSKGLSISGTKEQKDLVFEDGLRLQPKDFGVQAGMPVADVSAIKLDDGSWRLYAFAQNKGVVSAVSKDGLNFVAEAGSRLPDGSGMPRAMKLEDGRIRLYFITAGGVGSAISSDGLNFTVEKGLRVSPPAGLSEISGISTPVKLDDGKYHTYFSELPKPGQMIKAVHIYSATSDDLLTWVNDEGIRAGGDSVASSAEHPDVAVNKNGDVVMYFFVNEPQSLVYSISSDGLNFSKARTTGIKCNDANLAQLNGASYRIYCGDFDQQIGGVVKSALTDLPL